MYFSYCIYHIYKDSIYEDTYFMCYLENKCYYLYAYRDFYRIWHYVGACRVIVVDGSDFQCVHNSCENYFLS